MTVSGRRPLIGRDYFWLTVEQFARHIAAVVGFWS
ncbi:hypothetical protein GGD81_004035 [Rhodobium orientis]|nr:hypothetical protein [Rhodobium orientis]